MTVPVLRRRFTVEEFHRMAQAGILAEDDRVELLHGELVEMTPIGSRHAACVNRLNRLFSRQMGERVLVSVQNPIRLGELSEPQPDLMLLRPRPDDYAQAHPEAGEALLIVEVADTSMEVDRQVKVPLYARAGLREVWLVDLAGGTVEVYRNPSPEGFARVQRFSRGQSLSPIALPEWVIAVNDILG